jgi:hypothetical protein
MNAYLVTNGIRKDGAEIAGEGEHCYSSLAAATLLLPEHDYTDPKIYYVEIMGEEFETDNIEIFAEQLKIICEVSPADIKEETIVAAAMLAARKICRNSGNAEKLDVWLAGDVEQFDKLQDSERAAELACIAGEAEQEEAVELARASLSYSLRNDGVDLSQILEEAVKRFPAEEEEVEWL